MLLTMFYKRKITRLRFFLLYCLILNTMQLAHAFEPHTGDLIFQVEGNGDFSQAISQTTSFGDSLSFVHVGIIEVNNGDITVIEASPKSGVCVTPLDSFLTESPMINGNPGVVIKRLIICFPVKETIDKAKSHLGEDYDWWYLPDNGKMYCSELVYESFLDLNGNRLFKANPMNFRKEDGTIPEFWINLFNQLDRPVPEGIYGTNPQDLAKDKNLLEVYRFF